MELKAYQSHKIVRAMKITNMEETAHEGMRLHGADGQSVVVDEAYMRKHAPGIGGYYVVYEGDGYESWSPAEAFEGGYTSVQEVRDSRDNPPAMQKLTGYRTLSAEETALINEGKALAEQVGKFVAKLRDHPQTYVDGTSPVLLGEKPAIDQRWVSIGATHLQEGWMALTRSIAKPTTF